MRSADRSLPIRLTVNGEPREAIVETRKLLADFLREELGLSGTKLGCEQGVCGSCTVLLDGQTVRSCLSFAVQAAGRRVWTVEGVASDGALSPLQQEFWSHHGLQCGFCTPGMLIAAIGLLKESPEPDEDTIRKGLSGNVCRCTGYANIIEAVIAASKRYRTGELEPLIEELQSAFPLERKEEPA